MILSADNEGPDQTARMRRLIWAIAVRIRPNTFLQDASQMTLTIRLQIYIVNV